MNPSPRHSKCGRSSNTSLMHPQRRAVAVVRDDARVLVLDLAAALGSCRSIISTDCSRSSGSKPEITIGLP